jgi:retinol-binding protein 3
MQQKYLPWTLPFSFALHACVALDAPERNSSAALRSSALDSLDGPPANAAPPSMSAPVNPEPQPLDPAARDSAVQELAQLLADEYVFPDVGAQLQSSLLTHLGEHAYDAIDTAPALAAELTAELTEVAHDKHLRVNARLPPGAAPLAPRAPRAGIRRLEVLPDNIGYIALDAVPLLEVSRAAIAGAFAFLQQTDALIIDNRNNFGGSPATVAHYVSYLSEGPPALVSSLHERADRRIVEFYTEDLGQRSYGTARPVFVLTSAATFSGGEALTYDLQAEGRALIIGEVTGGGAHPVSPHPLGDQLIAVIPFAETINPITGTNWEGTGVQPDILIAADQALDEAHAYAHDQLFADPEYLASLSRPEPRPAISARRAAPLPSSSPNPIFNGDFSLGIEAWGVTDWQGNQQVGEHPYSLEGDRLCLTILPRQRVLIGWPPEETSYAFAVTRGARHQLSLKASSSGPLSIIADLSVGHRLPPYGSIAAARIPLDPTLESLTFDFEPDVSDDQTGFAIRLVAIGDSGETQVCFDDFLITADIAACSAP